MFNILRNLSYRSPPFPNNSLSSNYIHIASHYKKLYEMTRECQASHLSGHVALFVFGKDIKEGKFCVRKSNLRLMLLIIYDDDCFKSILRFME